MAESIGIDWLNENSFRAYPLKEAISRTVGGYTLTDDIILDAQFVYTSIPSPVQLLSIVANGTTVVFTISGGLTFTVPVASTFPVYTRLSSGNLLVVGEGIKNIPTGTYNFSNVTFETSVATEFDAEWLGVQSLQFITSPTTDVLVGDINFLQGYQFGINIVDPVITFTAGASYGELIYCTPFGDAPDDCSDIISYINGCAPVSSILRFVAGSGIVVLDDPTNHRIFIGLSFNPVDVCQTIVANPQL